MGETVLHQNIPPKDLNKRPLRVTEEGVGPFPAPSWAELSCGRLWRCYLPHHSLLWSTGCHGCTVDNQLESDHSSQASVYLILFCFQDRTLCLVKHKHNTPRKKMVPTWCPCVFTFSQKINSWLCFKDHPLVPKHTLRWPDKPTDNGWYSTGKDGISPSLGCL